MTFLETAAVCGGALKEGKVGAGRLARSLLLPCKGEMRRLRPGQ